MHFLILMTTCGWIIEFKWKKWFFREIINKLENAHGNNGIDNIMCNVNCSYIVQFVINFFLIIKNASINVGSNGASIWIIELQHPTIIY